MKLLYGIKSCQYDLDAGAHQIQRDTWIRDVTDGTVRFFIGGEKRENLFADEIQLECGDSYRDLPYKTQEICRYAIKQSYDFCVFADTGSFIIPHHLMNSGCFETDYTGYWGMKSKTIPYVIDSVGQPTNRPVKIPDCFCWGAGGGYCLSRKAMQFIADATPHVSAEDLWVAQVLAKHGIFLNDKAIEGWRGYVADWISGERNETAKSWQDRRQWMIYKQKEAYEICNTEGCNSPRWCRSQTLRDEANSQIEIERILAERRKARRMKQPEPIPEPPPLVPEKRNPWLIAIKSCETDMNNGMHSAIRESWGRDTQAAGFDLVFFVGRNIGVQHQDEVSLDCSDLYNDLPYKSKEIYTWALKQGYEYAFLCDSDTFTIPKKLAETDFKNYDYFGTNFKELGQTFFYRAPNRDSQEEILPACYPWHSGGIGAFLSRKAMEIMADAIPTSWAEDLFCGQVMGPLYNQGVIKMVNAENLNGVASWHYPRAIYYAMPNPRPPLHEVVKTWQADMHARHNQ